MRRFSKIEGFINFFILDSARLDRNYPELEKYHALAVSLYRGYAQQMLGDVAPYLARCREGSKISSWLYESGWGNSWGIFLQSDSPLQDVRKHFRRFLLVQTEGGEEMYFRFYDPRVLRVFLPTCSREQLSEFFGPIRKYVVEDENPSYALIFSLESGRLRSERINLEEEEPELLPVPEVGIQRKSAEKKEPEDNTIV